MKECATLHDVSISELFRSSVLEKIENDIDLKLYHQEIAEHRSSPNDISFNEMIKELGLHQ